jgi:hypothetical protein
VCVRRALTVAMELAVEDKTEINLDEGEKSVAFQREASRQREVSVCSCVYTVWLVYVYIRTTTRAFLFSANSLRRQESLHVCGYRRIYVDACM